MIHSTPPAIRRLFLSFGAVLAAALMAGGLAAEVRAEEQEREAFDTRIIRGLLEGLGLRRDGQGIDYRERSPLVVPPSRSLIPPENLAAERQPGWPTDPDVVRARQMQEARRRPTRTVEEESVPELPSQLNRQGAASRPEHRPTGEIATDPTAPSSFWELGSKNIFTRNAFFGRDREEYTAFTQEPPRTRLIQPPAGYRTPSPDQPYGVGSRRTAPAAINPMDTPAMRGE